MNDLDVELREDPFVGFEEHNDHYYGPIVTKARKGFKSKLDIKKGDFILLHLDHANTYSIWLVVA